MKRPVRDSDGTYTIKSKKYRELFGSRRQVWNGTAYKTSGNLTKSDFIMNDQSRIVSKKKHVTAKKEKRLEKYGFFAEKGKFGYVKGAPRKSMKKSRKNMKRGGSALSPADYNSPVAPTTTSTATVTEAPKV
jgi:hypothetical protein